MIVFVSCNSNLTSNDFAQECVEKYLYLIRFTNNNIKTTSKTIKLIKKNNKPYLNDELKISISNKTVNKKNVYVVAISTKEVGIDCEIRSNINNKDKIIKTYFTENEAKESATLYGFYKIWTQKEAIFKADNTINKIAVKIDTDKYKEYLTTFNIYENLVISIYSKDKNIYIYEMEDGNTYGKNKRNNC